MTDKPEIPNIQPRTAKALQCNICGAFFRFWRKHGRRGYRTSHPGHMPGFPICPLESPGREGRAWLAAGWMPPAWMLYPKQTSFVIHPHLIQMDCFLLRFREGLQQVFPRRGGKHRNERRAESRCVHPCGVRSNHQRITGGIS